MKRMLLSAPVGLVLMGLVMILYVGAGYYASRGNGDAMLCCVASNIPLGVCYGLWLAGDEDA
jgi:hypothetical protein